MKNILKFKKIIFSSFAIALASTFVTAGNTSALVDTPWGPSRTTFTWENPAPYATFNSITNNPQVGDERNFVRIREVADDTTFGDEVTLEMGKTYEVYIYYHNNADANDVGTTALGIADGASVKSSFPATVKKGEKATVTATIFAADTDPLAVWDGAYMRANRDIYLRYVPGTAIIHNGGTLNGQSIGPDYLFGDGALLGYNKFSGLLPGCNQYAGYVTYQIFADAPDFKVEKTIVGNKTNIKAGDEITYKIRYENTGTMNQMNVVVRDTLPKDLIYIPGSTILYNNNLTDGKSVNDDLVTENGMNIGNYAGGNGWAEVVYRVKVSDNMNCGGKIINSAIVSTTDGNKTASATVRIAANDKCTEPSDDPDLDDPDPDDPDPDNPDPDDPNPTDPDPETPEEIVNTGPVEIIMAIIIVLGIGVAGFYFYRTRRVLKTVEGEVSGKDKEDKDDTLPKS